MASRCTVQLWGKEEEEEEKNHDINQFRSVLKSFLLINSFYSSEEYFAWNSTRDLGSV